MPMFEIPPVGLISSLLSSSRKLRGVAVFRMQMRRLFSFPDLLGFTFELLFSLPSFFCYRGGAFIHWNRFIDFFCVLSGPGLCLIQSCSPRAFILYVFLAGNLLRTL